MGTQWMEEDRLVFKLCSLFLRYPDKEWTESEEASQIVDEINDKGMKYCLRRFLTYVNETSFKEMCENYVRWFDFSEPKTLYLTHGRFGENRERGLAFVKLKMEFAKAGFYIKNDELPDYLPLILEFASIAEKDFVQKVFLIHKKAIDLLLTELEKEDNPYGFLLKACLAAIATHLPPSEKDTDHHAG
ncbi:nitrate reductase molybdenum cofactor assembly chaperone [Bacillus paralicheniformis]|uniref:nitrate reductase molybdenum cofactor assembly chaperone n=1 Tax=Bacillus paralicheniformis TaxID=1648923 RepID=UPI0012AB89EA|nr:nitrate reductase molybdenum cofactor assembly chaperone [Bacillus paralicheniformis]MDE1392019.1 nitrate reductase molybdenum cofactor assembly chaperone [Bacillus paralicheniformis]MED0804135.1 nitrate reductase molybdenum cofactor assembly chaperone [Bacillus paralicheniformis]